MQIGNVTILGRLGGTAPKLWWFCIRCALHLAADRPSAVLTKIRMIDHSHTDPKKSPKHGWPPQMRRIFAERHGERRSDGWAYCECDRDCCEQYRVVCTTIDTNCRSGVGATGPERITAQCSVLQCAIQISNAPMQCK